MNEREQPETDTLARQWLEAGDRAMRDGLPAAALAFRNMAWRENPELAEAWPRIEDADASTTRKHAR